MLHETPLLVRFSATDYASDGWSVEETAVVAGWAAERAWDRHFLLAMAGFTLATVAPFVVGVPYLAGVLGLTDPAAIAAVGITPFIVPGLVKVIVVPAKSSTTTRSSPASLLSRLDLPTLGRPMRATRRGPPSGSALAEAETSGMTSRTASRASPLPRP